jgi:hypothetical protein
MCFLRDPCPGCIRGPAAILRRLLDEQQVDERWPLAWENENPGAEERPPLEGVTQQEIKDRDWEQ